MCQNIFSRFKLNLLIRGTRVLLWCGVVSVKEGGREAGRQAEEKRDTCMHAWVCACACVRACVSAFLLTSSVQTVHCT